MASLQIIWGKANTPQILRATYLGLQLPTRTSIALARKLLCIHACPLEVWELAHLDNHSHPDHHYVPLTIPRTSLPWFTARTTDALVFCQGPNDYSRTCCYCMPNSPSSAMGQLCLCMLPRSVMIDPPGAHHPHCWSCAYPRSACPLSVFPAKLHPVSTNKCILTCLGTHRYYWNLLQLSKSYKDYTTVPNPNQSQSTLPNWYYR